MVAFVSKRGPYCCTLGRLFLLTKITLVHLSPVKAAFFFSGKLFILGGIATLIALLAFIRYVVIHVRQDATKVGEIPKPILTRIRGR